MSHPILQKYRTLRIYPDGSTVNRLLSILIRLPKSQHRDLIGKSAHAGRFFLFRHDSAPNQVLEYVPDIQNDSSVTTLYGEHPVFESRQTLINAREEIISAIDTHLLSIPNTATVWDEGREKMFIFPELGTAQLLDVLTIFVGGEGIAKVA